LTPIDLAEPDIEKYLEELKKKQMEKPKINVCQHGASFVVKEIKEKYHSCNPSQPPITLHFVFFFV
jgi:hypothetical protein